MSQKLPPPGRLYASRQRPRSKVGREEYSIRITRLPHRIQPEALPREQTPEHHRRRIPQYL